MMLSPAGLTSQPQSLGGMLGQRKLFGLGIFMAWVVLFHLLVNVWLLCVFTSFLVVVGAWFGSKVILDSNSVIHLERFVTMERIISSEESEQLLDNEIENTVGKIIRDFVSSWYCTVSQEHEFENEVQRAMVAMAMELKLRSKRVDRKALTQRTLDLFGRHLQSYMRAKETMVKTQKQKYVNSLDTIWKLYSEENTPHPALESSAVEVNYARAIVDLLLHVLVPPPHLETRTGRFVVGELITCNVLLPLITKLSDPDWLNMMIVEILTKSIAPDLKPSSPLEILPVEAPPDIGETEVPPLRKVPDKPDGPSKIEILTAEMPVADAVDSAVSCCHQDTDEDSSRAVNDFTAGPAPTVRRPVDFLRPGKSNPFYQENDSDLDSPLTELKKCSTESLVLISPMYDLTDRTKEDAAVVDSIVDLEDDLSEFPGMTELSCPKVLVSEEHRGSVSDTGRTEEMSSFCSLRELEQECPAVEKTVLAMDQQQTGGLAVSPNELSVSVPLQASSPTAGMMPPGSFNFDQLSPEGPVIIQNLRITGTITAREHRGTGSHPYTLYTVKYETTLDADNPCPVQPVAYHMVNRRYSEFLNLQTRLEEKPELRKIIKNVKGPKKIFPDLPFGNMDSDKVEARKSLLENFLKQLCAIPETANSDEMQEFLALNTDARIAFVKKPFIVSRIDKIVVNAIVDTLKTAFPRSEPLSPTDEAEVETDGRLLSDKKSKSRLRFPSKTAPALIVTNITPKVLYCFDEESTVFKDFSVAGLETFIEEQEVLVGKAGLHEPGTNVEGSVTMMTERQDCGNPTTQSSTVSDVALKLLCMLMKDQWSWVCTENIQRAIRLVFGTLIDRWLEVKVCNLTCTEYWVTYLRVLQEAVWPGGHLPLLPRPQRSPQEKEQTRQQSLRCLMKLLPDLVSDVLGSEKYKLSWQTVLDSLQDPYINRHLVYSIWDLLLEFIIPEVTDEAFQKSLLHSLSKNADKLLS